MKRILSIYYKIRYSLLLKLRNKILYLLEWHARKRANQILDEFAFKHEKDLEEIAKLKAQGHDHLCACNQVWGKEACICTGDLFD